MTNTAHDNKHLDADYQRACDELVRREVYANVSYLISELAQDERYMDDILEFSERPDYSEPPEGYTVARLASVEFHGFEEWSFMGDDEPVDGFDSEQEAIKAAWEDSGDEPERIEALEFWIVSDWLAHKLDERDELVTHDFLGLTIWGRTTSGQAISIDRVIYDIYDEISGS